MLNGVFALVLHGRLSSDVWRHFELARSSVDQSRGFECREYDPAFVLSTAPDDGMCSRLADDWRRVFYSVLHGFLVGDRGLGGVDADPWAPRIIAFTQFGQAVYRAQAAWLNEEVLYAACR